jgi:putative membrane protein
MIENYSDHAANERTFLAWIRTGIATIAFGFVVEKFNLFILTLAEASESAKRLRLERFSGSISRYDGLALILVGMAIIVVSVIRFARTSRMIDDQTAHSASSVRAELVLSIGLALIVAVLSAHLVYVEF